MQLHKAHKEAKFAAVASISLGIIGLLSSFYFGFVFVAQSGAFATATNDEHVQAMNMYLILAVKALIFGVIPGCCIVMIATGFSMLRYLKIESRDSQIQSPE
jgi:lysylphosphatidylglycerol synthetase-like protein (DUF2156 family)